MSDVPSLQIVVVNWNAGSHLRRCLSTIASAAITTGFRLDRVTVVDNASTDGSLEGLDEVPLPLSVARNRTNRGFGAACNQGARESRSEYVLFLNPDTQLTPEALFRPIAFLEDPEHRLVAVAGIQLVDDVGTVSRTCARFPTPAMFAIDILGLDRLWPGLFQSHVMAAWDHAETMFVPHVMGAFYLMRRTVFEAVGGFDERYFVYLEDLDLSRRIHDAGWRIAYLADARAYHKGGGSSEQVKAARLAYALRSRIQYGYRHFGLVSATALALETLMVAPVVRGAHAAVRRRPGELRDVVQAFRMLWGSVLRRALPPLG